MKATVLSVTGWEGAITAMFLSKRTWTPTLGDEIRKAVQGATDVTGHYIYADQMPNDILSRHADDVFRTYTEKLFKWGPIHITLLRFIDIVIMTEGMHRGGQDDIDAHSKRFENRIIRNSTRLSTFDEQEVSDFYSDKILTDGQVARALGFELPKTVEIEGQTWVKSTNGYVMEQYSDDKDVKRGLYMLSIPSNFISKINLCEWAHVFRERCKDGGANPEVKQWAEEVNAQLAQFNPLLTREYILSIKN